MVDLNLLPEDTYRTLIALPYRIGYFISVSDTTGGSDSEEQELTALENLFTFYVEDTLKSEFAQSVMLATLQHKTHWSDWRHNIQDVPNECTEIVSYLESRLDVKNLVAFKNNLLEIGVTVAMAFNESKYKNGLIEGIKKLVLPPKISTINHGYLNISADEKSAINLLAEKFSIPYRVS